MALHRFCFAIFFLISVALCQNTAVNVIQPCTYTDPSGAHYDLSSMIIDLDSSTSKHDLYYGEDPNGFEYYANICNVVSSDTHCPVSDETPVCQIDESSTKYASCGSVSAQQFKPGNGTLGVEIWYPNGAGCNNGVHPNRTSIFHIQCGETNSLTMSSAYEDECWYELYLESTYGCPVSHETTPFHATATVSSSSTSMLYHSLTSYVSGSLELYVSGNSTLIEGAVNSVIFEGGHRLLIEKLVSSDTYSTSLGLCTVGILCELPGYTITLFYDDDDQPSPTDNYSSSESLCFLNAQYFTLENDSEVVIEGDCLYVTALSGVTVHLYLEHSDAAATASDFQFFPETLSLTYLISSNEADLYWTQTCQVSGGETVCRIVNPLWIEEEYSEGSFLQVMGTMTGELLGFM